MKIAALEDYKSDPPLLLKLVTQLGYVSVVAVDAEGCEMPRGRLLSIWEDGVQLHSNVDPQIGLPLDSTLRVKLLFQPGEDHEIMQLLKPLAEYIAARKVTHGLATADDAAVLADAGGIQPTLGMLNALAAYYEAHK